jgi:Reverse transcriptase (RNA-dependent DNA polymerase)
LFIKHDHTYITIVLVYMDDIIIIGNNSTQIRELKGKLKENFDIKGLDFLKYFFKSLDSIFTWRSFSLTKEVYIRIIKRDEKKLGRKPIWTPYW